MLPSPRVKKQDHSEDDNEGDVARRMVSGTSLKVALPSHRDPSSSTTSAFTGASSEVTCVPRSPSLYSAFNDRVRTATSCTVNQSCDVCSLHQRSANFKEPLSF